MKVICIQEAKSTFRLTGEKATSPQPRVGEYFHVVGSKSLHFLDGSVEEYYELQEFPPTPNKHLYNAIMFAEVSDIDETELVNAKPEVDACV